MSTFEIRDEEIDVEKILERIRENIKKRRQQSGYSEAQRLLQEPRFKPQVSGVESGDLKENLCAANTAWQVQVRFSQPWPKDKKLSLLETNSITEPASIRLLEKLNQNFAKLNELLFECQDYAVIARKI